MRKAIIVTAIFLSSCTKNVEHRVTKITEKSLSDFDDLVRVYNFEYSDDGLLLYGDTVYNGEISSRRRFEYKDSRLMRVEHETKSQGEFVKRYIDIKYENDVVSSTSSSGAVDYEFSYDQETGFMSVADVVTSAGVVGEWRFDYKDNVIEKIAAISATSGQADAYYEFLWGEDGTLERIDLVNFNVDENQVVSTDFEYNKETLSGFSFDGERFTIEYDSKGRMQEISNINGRKSYRFDYEEGEVSGGFGTPIDVMPMGFMFDMSGLVRTSVHPLNFPYFYIVN